MECYRYVSMGTKDSHLYLCLRGVFIQVGFRRVAVQPRLLIQRLGFLQITSGLTVGLDISFALMVAENPLCSIHYI